MAMIRVHDELDRSATGARLLLQVHDELVLEVPEDRVEEVRDMVVGQMESVMELAVPLVAEAGTGKSWYTCKA
jgi:DNA polymerase-1